MEPILSDVIRVVRGFRKICPPVSPPDLSCLPQGLFPRNNHPGMVSAMLHAALKRNRMKKSWLTAKELATLLQVSIKTVRRAYRNGEIPMVRFRHMVRFDLAQVRRAMARNGRSRMRRLNGTSTKQCATGGAAAGTPSQRPPVGKTGAFMADDLSRKLCQCPQYLGFDSRREVSSIILGMSIENASQMYI